METKLRILIFEDIEPDAAAIEAELRAANLPAETRHVVSRAAFVAELEGCEPDVIVADYSLPNHGSGSALSLVQDRCPDVPFVFVSGIVGEDVAIAALKSGATDYILKHRLWQLGPAVRRALRESQQRHERRVAEQALRESEQRLRGILTSLKETLITVLDANGVILATWMDAQLEKRLGRHSNALVGKNLEDWPGGEAAQAWRQAMARTFESGEHVVQEAVLAGPHGDVWLETTFSPIQDTGGGISSVVAVVRDVTDRKRAEQAMRVAQRRLDSAREEERRRVARELHDSIGQQIGVLRLYLRRTLLQHEASMNPLLVDDLNKVSDQCNELLDEVRAISYGLYPPLLEALGLAACLHQFASDSHASVPVEVQCDESLEKARFDDEVEIALYRIAQEAMNNALRHGQAQRIKLQLECKGEEIVLTIVDDGVGFRVSEAAGQGLGLNAMQERASSIGGTLQIHSKPGNTRVQVRVKAIPRLAVRPAV